MIVAAGGVAVLAHPATHGRYRSMDDSVIAQLVDAGLFGLEVDHRDNTAEGRVWLTEVAQRYALVMTGSSDYHGDGKPNRLAENTTPRAVYEQIVDRGTGSAPFAG